MGTQSIWTVWKSSTRLADGREIVYFDEAPGLGRDQVRDTRPLPPRMPGPQPPHGRAEWGVRWDLLAGEWVVIAAARQDRTFLPPADQCPLDPSTPGRPTEVPADGYDVVVFENRFPSLAEPLGRCEVVCFTSDHDSSFAALSPRRVKTVLEAWIDRTLALGALPETRQVYCFENRGEEIGVKPAPYIAAWHQAPAGDADAGSRFAAHLQVLSVRRTANKLKYLAGTESGMGVRINDIVPEEAAQRLREA